MIDYKERLSQMQIQQPFNSTSEQVYEILLNAIISGELPGGIQIKQSSLAEKFGLSRTPVREAVTTLIKGGYIEKSEHGNLRVYVFNPKDYSELILFRIQLESLAVQLAAINSTESDIAELNRCLDMQNDAKMNSDHQASLLADESFHLAIINACKNQYVINSYLQNLTKIRFYRTIISPKQNWNSTYRYHEKIVRAITERNPEEGIKSLKQHLNISKDLAYLSF